MKSGDNQEKILSYLEGSLQSDEGESFEQEIQNNSALKAEFEQVSKVYQLLNDMSEKKVKAPIGFDLEVMKAIDNISPVNKRSSVMKSIIGFKRRFMIPLVPAVTMALVLLVVLKNNTSDDFIDFKLNSSKEVLNQPIEVAASQAIKAELEEKALSATGNLSSVDVRPVAKPVQADMAGNKKSNLEISAPSEKKVDSYQDGRMASSDLGLKIILKKGKWVKESEGNQPAAAARRDLSNVEFGKVTSDLDQNSNSEEYHENKEATFVRSSVNPLSTFSIDVDTGSYSNIRRFLTRNQLPPKDAVRIEEMLNYFKYDYKVPESREVPFAVETELSKAPWSDKNQLLHIGIKGYEEKASNLPSSNLVFLIDVSGSMESSEKLPLLKQGLRLLVEQMRPQDKVALVVYAGAAGVVLDSKDGGQKQEILAAIENMQAGGSTAGGAGIELAYKTAKSHFIQGGNNRVILATDGDFNVGISSDEELIKLIEEKRKSGIFLSVLGFGVGNYKDGKMEQLANKGNGNYAYIDNIQEAKKVLVSDMTGTLFTIAKDVKIQIEFNPAYVQAYRLIGYENRLLNKEDFNDDKKDAGELGAGHSVTALYEIVPAGVEFFQGPSVDELKYQKVEPSPTSVAKVEGVKNQELATVKLRYKLPSEDNSKLVSKIVSSTPIADGETSNNFKFSSAVAQFGMILRDSEFKGSATFDSTLKLSEGSKGEDKLGYRAEFIKLVDTARLLSK